MKKINAYLLLYFLVIIIVAALVSCSSKTMNVYTKCYEKETNLKNYNQRSINR
jgi:hypothetical protein